MPRQRKPKKAASTTANLGFEVKLWEAADKMRPNMHPADYTVASPTHFMR